MTEEERLMEAIISVEKSKAQVHLAHLALTKMIQKLEGQNMEVASSMRKDLEKVLHLIDDLLVDLERSIPSEISFPLSPSSVSSSETNVTMSVNISFPVSRMNDESPPSEDCEFMGKLMLTAARYDTISDVQKLLEKGVDVDYHDRYRMTALHFAARNGSEEMILLLLDKGADINARDYDGNTVLHWASTLRTGVCVSLLVGAGANVNSRNFYGFTPLHWAARFDLERPAMALLAAGANKLVYDNNRKTPFDIAMGQFLRKMLQP